MGKRSRQKRFAKEADAEKTSPPQSVQSRPLASPNRRWLKLAFGITLPLALLLFAETALRVFSYGYSTRFLEKAADGTGVTVNPRFTWQYYSPEVATSPTPLLCSVIKPAGTLRIVVLGESAAAGTPDPAFGFARVLEVLLAKQYPGRKFEVINAAMRGINSHVILPIARECAELQPDLFVVYMGNNEVIGLHSPTPGQFGLTDHLWLLRLGQKVKATRLAQLAQATARRFVSPKPDRKQDMEYMRRQRLAFDDPQREAVYENFADNLEEICHAIRSASAPAIVATVGVNLRDFPPLGSLHRAGLKPAELADWERNYSAGIAAEAKGSMAEARAHYEMAARIDDHFAELQFRLARCHEAEGRVAEARQHYLLARDWDALQFRADSRINSSIRQLGTNASDQGIYFADTEKAFGESPLAENGVPGQRLFHEHVHLTFEGDYHLARSLVPVAAEALRLGPAKVSVPSRDDCARALAFTAIDELNVRAAMIRQTAKAPFLDQIDHARQQAESERVIRESLGRLTAADFEKAGEVYREALASRPDDWMLRYNYANLLSDSGKHAAAVGEYESVVKRLPRQRAFRTALGHALLKSGRPTEAAAQFAAVLELDPHFRPARDALLMAQRRPR